MATDLTTRSTALTTTNDTNDLVTLCGHLAKSGMFADARDVSKAIVKVLAGREYGFGPIASMTGIHVIEGKPSMGAHLMAALIKRSGKLDYKIVELTRERCELAFLYRIDKTEHTEKPKKTTITSTWEPCGPNIALTMKEMIQTGVAVASTGKLKANWSKHADDMLFARCISKGWRRYCAELAGGMTTYVEGEIETPEDAIDTTFVQTVHIAPETQPEPASVELEASDVPKISREQFGEVKKSFETRPKDYHKKLLHILGLKTFGEMPATWLPIVCAIARQFEEPIEFQGNFMDCKPMTELGEDKINSLLMVAIHGQQFERTK